MADIPGPKLLYPLKVVAKSIVNNDPLSLYCPLSGENDDDERRPQLLQVCVKLLLAVQDPTDHYKKLDMQLLSLLPNAFHQHPSMFTGPEEGAFEVSQAVLLLQRLPSIPQKLLDFGLTSRILSAETDTLGQRMVRARWSPDWLMKDARQRVKVQASPTDPNSVMEELRYASDTIWSDFYVTNYIDSNSLVFLLKQSPCKDESNWELSKHMYQYLNILAELLDVYEGFCNGLGSGEEGSAFKAAIFPNDAMCDPQRLNIIKAFLWTAWQRSIMLHFYKVVGVQLSNGASLEWSNLLAVRGVSRLVELSDHHGGHEAPYRGSNTSPYLCNWSLELLRRSRSALCLDFRHLIERFSCHFAGRSGRCIRDSDETCIGDQPGSCQRFTGAETSAQSAHRATCDKRCGRISWNESSYRATESPRAVCIEISREEMHYRLASENSIAISHVWAHGQGGRPEEGINRCLHELYCCLARKYACDSYWIDSACIPTEEKLRKEAIAKINTIFAHSKVVILSDEDVQSVNLQSESIDILETVLSVLLVCDWNVRAWTMLEATRANQSVHLLCKNDSTILLLELLQRVWKEGAVDLAVLIGSAEHLLPLGNSTARSLEDAGYSLSQRHASRLGDDVIIWSLLNNSVGRRNAAELWKAQQCVRTAYLMSSAPRIEDALGLGWAPSTPTIVPQVRCIRCGSLNQHYIVRYHNYDGKGSYIGRITRKGLLGKWLFKEMDHDAIEDFRNTYCKLMPSSWRTGESQYLDLGDEIPEDSEIYSWPDIASACGMMAELLMSSRVRILKPIVTDGTAVYTGGDNRGDFTGGVVAICSSECEADVWHWRGVYQWAEGQLFLDWTIGEMLIV